MCYNDCTSRLIIYTAASGYTLQKKYNHETKLNKKTTVIKKKTVAHLDKLQSLAIKGGNAYTQPANATIPTLKSALPYQPCRLTIIQPGTLL